MAAPMQNTTIIKINYGTDMRRLSKKAGKKITWENISDHVVEWFGLDKQSFQMTYIDEEQDRITISTDEELADAIALAQISKPPVLRLTVDEKRAKRRPKVAASTVCNTESKHSDDPSMAAETTASNPMGAVPELAAFMETLSKQLPAAMASLPASLRNLIPNAELDVAATVAANQVARLSGDPFCPMNMHTAQGKPGVHEGVTCDKSGMCPIVGNRYHLVGHNYDLCEAEYAKLPDKEKALFRKVAPPPDEPVRSEGTAASGPKCDGAQGSQGLHPGIECDRSGMCPIVGTRYHLRGHNYDLCQAEFDKLPTAEQALYEAIPPLVPHCMAEAAAHFAAAAAAEAGAVNKPWRPGQCGWRARAEKGPSARFVRDVSIFDGTQMSPGTNFTKIWRIKNVGEVPWPAGTRILFVGGDQMTTEISVPLSRESPVFPGDEVDVAVEMTAPKELGRYLGYWRLTGPHSGQERHFGRRKFGQRVWCHIQVVDPTQPLAAFDDLQTTVAEIERKKQTLAATEKDADIDAADATNVDVDTTTADSPTPQPKSLQVSWSTSDVPVDAPTIAPTAPPSTPKSDSTNVIPAEWVKTEADGEDGENGIKEDGSLSDDAVIVTESMLADGEATVTSAKAASPSGAKPPPQLSDTEASLHAMGFSDIGMIRTVVDKNGDDVEACARDLAAASEWESLLDDLAEMGFTNRELNQSLMLKHAGNIKRTVKDLVDPDA